MPHPISDLWIERGLNRALAVGALLSWIPATTREPGPLGALAKRRQWLLTFNDGSSRTMPAGAAWAFCQGVRETVKASDEN